MEIRVGKYRTRGGTIAIVSEVRNGDTLGYTAFGSIPGVDIQASWQPDGRYSRAVPESINDLIERIEEPTPVDESDSDVVDAEFVPPEFVEVPNAGAIGVDVSGASLRPAGPTIGDVIEHERAETAAFASATEEANRHAFAALRSLTRALNRHGIAPGSEVADAHAFALLVIDGFDS